MFRQWRRQPEARGGQYSFACPPVPRFFFIIEVTKFTSILSCRPRHTLTSKSSEKVVSHALENSSRHPALARCYKWLCMSYTVIDVTYCPWLNRTLDIPNSWFSWRRRRQSVNQEENCHVLTTVFHSLDPDSLLFFFTDTDLFNCMRCLATKF